MTTWTKSFLPLALFAAVLHGPLLTGCGGKSTPTGVANSGEVRLKLVGAAARLAAGGARSVSVSGATVLVDGVSAGVTNADGEITLQLDPGTYTITVTSGGVTSSAFQVTIGEAEVLTLEVEMATDGTLTVEQDIDKDGDVDEQDKEDPDDEAVSEDTDDEDDSDDTEDADDADDADDDDTNHGGGSGSAHHSAVKKG